MHAHKLNSIASILMPLSLGTMGIGAYVGFIAPDIFTLHTQVVAHVSILLGAVTLKLSYIMHLNASKHLKINDFAELSSGTPHPLTTPCEGFVHECCLTGMHRL